MGVHRVFLPEASGIVGRHDFVASEQLTPIAAQIDEWVNPRELNFVRVDVRNAGIAVLVEDASIDGDDPKLEDSAAARQHDLTADPRHRVELVPAEIPRRMVALEVGVKLNRRLDGARSAARRS